MFLDNSIISNFSDDNISIFSSEFTAFYGHNQRIYRIYRELELNLRIKPKKRLIREKPDSLSVPDNINQCCSMDFMYDELQNGRKYRLFNVIDDFNREGLVIEIDYSLPAERVIRALEQAIEWRGFTL